ncbi:hypothetical protein, partial [Phosphitispora fastidiosa]|uniref:hypothetical protein n=1 Tax=Phosphitispora fastidiosa TaxID=2837202 RepID=UPI001E6216E1
TISGEGTGTLSAEIVSQDGIEDLLDTVQPTVCPLEVEVISEVLVAEDASKESAVGSALKTPSSALAFCVMINFIVLPDSF